MIRKLIFTTIVLIAMLPAVQAVTIGGIQIESSSRRVVVCIDGQQVSRATHSCFLSGLSGLRRIQIYAAAADGMQAGRGELLYDRQVDCRMTEVKVIELEGGRGQRVPEGRHGRSKVMSPDDFDRFLEQMKRQSFDSERKRMVENVVLTSEFTTGQAVSLMAVYSFDSDRKAFLKKIYPRITDKHNFYQAIDKLTFDSDKREVEQFVAQYHKSNH